VLDKQDDSQVFRRAVTKTSEEAAYRNRQAWDWVSRKRTRDKKGTSMFEDGQPGFPEDMKPRKERSSEKRAEELDFSDTYGVGTMASERLNNGGKKENGTGEGTPRRGMGQEKLHLPLPIKCELSSKTVPCKAESTRKSRSEYEEVPSPRTTGGES